MKVLSIQSSVAYGHVGNSAAAFPLQRLGHEVWPVSTVHFSNHTGYPTSRGPRISADDVRDILRGIEDRGAFAECDAVLSGYAGTREVLEVIVAAVERVRRANPAVVFCCDPVLGDTEQGFFVGPGIPEFLRDTVVPAADVITPNHFELDFLAGRTTRTLEEVLDAVDLVRAGGPSNVLVTSLLIGSPPFEEVQMLAVSDDGAFLVSTPLLDLTPSGCGDLTAALYLAHLHETGSTERALALTTSAVFDVVEATLAAGTREIALIPAQDRIAARDERFPVTEVR